MAIVGEVKVEFETFVVESGPREFGLFDKQRDWFVTCDMPGDLGLKLDMIAATFSCRL